MQRSAPIALAFVLAALAGCAFDLAQVEQRPAASTPRASAAPSFTLERAVDVDLGLGYRRVLRAGTRWSYVGTVDAGDVYRTSDQVLTVEASNIHEAYAVVAAGRLVGFYLPVERTYSPAVAPVALPMR